MIKKILSLLVLIVSCGLIELPAFAEGDAKSDLKNKLDGYDLTFLLPVNVLGEKGTRINLKFSTPKGFRCLQKEKLISGDLALLEFIPEKDDENKWSEIITSSLYVGKSIKASALTSQFKDVFVQASTESKILEENTTPNDSFETAVLAMTYTHKGRREVVRVKALSGPLDCVATQYAIALKEGQTVEDALNKIKTWMEDPQNMDIVKF